MQIFKKGWGPQERVLKTGEGRGLFCKRLGSENYFEKRACIGRSFENKWKSEGNFEKN